MPTTRQSVSISVQIVDGERNACYMREKVRDLPKYIVQIGGVAIIDALEEPELRELVTGSGGCDTLEAFS